MVLGMSLVSRSVGTSSAIDKKTQLDYSMILMKPFVV